MTKKVRLSNIELLRAISMLMVLGLHANYLANGRPESETVLGSEFPRVLLEQTCLGAVNLFVLISGWFGIKASLKGFCNLMWQVMFFSGLALAYSMLIEGNSISIKEWLSLFGLYGGGGWFTAAYIGLYILSPVLNSFLDRCSLPQIVLILGAYYLYELFWGSTLSVAYICNGYSLVSFIFLYLLAGTLKRHQPTVKKWKWLGLYALCIVLNSVFYALSISLNQIAIAYIFQGYLGPFIIIGPTSLLLFFAGMQPFGPKATKIINWFAASSFAVYLLHASSNLFLSKYGEVAHEIYVEYSGLGYMWRIIGFMVGVYMLATVLDQVRIAIWKHLLGPAAAKLQAAVERRIENA